MIGVGVIGYGYWGPNLARCVAESTTSRLVAIADNSSRSQARAAQRHASARITGDWRSLLSDPSIDAIAIATPARLHFEMALAALQAGKHVLVEKPIASTTREAAILIQEAHRRKLVLAVDHTFIYTGAVQKIKDLVTSGLIGDIYYYDSTRINLGLFQTDINVVWDLAVHDLAILDFVINAAPLAISATGATHIKGSPENMANITIYLEGGATAHLNVNWLAPVKIRRTLVGGSRRMIVYDDMEASEKIKVYDRGVDVQRAADQTAGDVHTVLTDYRMGDVWTPHIKVSEALLTEIDHFAACIENNLVPLTDGESGLRVLTLLEGASRSLRQRGQPIELTEARLAS